MALQTYVKVSGISNLSDARYCAGMGVEVLGYSFDPTDAHHVLPEQYMGISAWVSGVQNAAEFNNCTPEQIEEQLALYGSVDLVQITDYRHLPLLKKLEIPLALKLNVSAYRNLDHLGDILREAQQDVAYFLIENETEEKEEEWLNVVLELADQYPVLLGFGVTPQNVLSLIENSSLKGIALQGGEETKPGFKTYDELADILEVLEIDDLES